MAPPTNDKIRAAFNLLGLRPGATQDDARRATRMKHRVLDPKNRPAVEHEKAKEELDTVDEALRLVLMFMQQGRKLHDFDTPRNGEDREPPVERDAKVRFDGEMPAVPAPAEPKTERVRKKLPGMSILEVRGPAGAGKTTEFCKYVAAESEPRHTIFCGPTIEFLTEAEGHMRKAGLKPTVIHSKSDNTKNLVNVKLARYFRDTNRTDDAVLLITHAALMEMPDALVVDKVEHGVKSKVEVFRREDWDLVIDEAPEILTFYSESWPLTHDIISNRVDAYESNNSLYCLRPRESEHEPNPNETFLRMLGGDIPHDTNISDATREIARALCNPNRLVLVHKQQWDELAWRDDRGRPLNPYRSMIFQGTIDVCVVATPRAFQRYRSTTVMGARLESTMYHVLWNKLCDMKFKKHPLQDKLPQTHTNGRRLRLFYLTDHAPNREFLVRASAEGGDMFSAMARRVSEHFGPQRRNRQFIWSAPLDRGSVYGVRDSFWQAIKARMKTTASPRPGQRPFDPDLRLGGRAMGVNRYRNYHNFVGLNAVNFTPNQWVILQSLGLTDKEIYRAQNFNFLYQDLLRCSLRQRNVKDQVHAIVISKMAAEDLAQEFPNCRVEMMPDAPQLAEPKKAGRKMKTEHAGKSRREIDAARLRGWRAKQRAERERHRQMAKE